MINLFDLKKHAAIVTGGSKGLGYQMAMALSEAGADVVIGSRKKTEIAQAAKEISNTTGGKVLDVVLDVTDRDSVEAMVDKSIKNFGKIDILINNAGMNIRSEIDKITDEDWHRIQEVNVTGVFYCCRAVSKHMVKAGYGRIINIGSTLSLVGLPKRISYTASKGAVVQMTRTLALELAQKGVTVNCICPGPFATDINKPLIKDTEATKELLENVPMKRWGKLEEIKAPMLLLASPAASYITGAVLTVDGGWTAK